ncbi:MAG TPA: PTS sugar transporter subunit IIA [Planctomycetota bacterium]|nr:PTS sugar transporter subunit IIA [Planctomycetota bacterium]
MDISSLLAPDRIVFLKDETKDGAIKSLVRCLAKTPEVQKEKDLLKAIHDRERILSTGIGYGIAIPHAKIASVTGFVAAIGVSRNGVPFDSLDDKPAHLVVMIAGPEGQSEQYLRILSRFTAVLKNETTRNRIIESKKPDQVFAILQEVR